LDIGAAASDNFNTTFAVTSFTSAAFAVTSFTSVTSFT
jgi:hypothetical protein